MGCHCIVAAQCTAGTSCYHLPVILLLPIVVLAVALLLLL
jgi:hypothetical protein